MGFAVAEDQEFTLPPLEERPLVTFALFAYNQEKYIREAVEGAFAQTYEPLEIILSDDCSTDRTFEIMEEMEKTYKGPHQIRLNRNSRNLGVGPHIYHVYCKALGEIVISAAGDDISVPERTSNILKCWLDKKKKPALIFSAAIKIDKESKTLCELNFDKEETYFKNYNPLNPPFPVWGFSMAANRRLVLDFPPIRPGVAAEDTVFVRRASNFGGVLYANKPLVKYRIHPESITSSLISKSRIDYLKKKRFRYIDAISKGELFIEDLKILKHPEEIALRREIQGKITLWQLGLAILNENIYKSCKALINHSALSCKNLKDLKEGLKHFIVRWVPSALNYK